MKFLLDNNAYVDTISKKNGKTALLFSCEYGYVEIVNLLLNYKANLHAKSDSGETALMCAIEGNYFSLKKEHIEIVKLLLDKNIDVNANRKFSKETALMLACKKKAYDKDSLNRQTILVKLLLERGADINLKNKDGKTALMLAKEIRNSNIVTLLCNMPSHLANNDLLMYAEKGDLDGVKNAIAAGADIDVQRYNEDNALTIAIKNGNLDIIKFLLEKNANTNLTFRFDVTPLMVAVSAVANKSVEIVKLLLDHKASFEAQNSLGMTPLIITCIGILNDPEYQQITLDIVTLLLDAGANINIANKEGMTALMYASTTWFPSIAEYLVANGANIYAKDKKGKTAFMYAAEKGSLPIVKYLFEKNIDLNETDKEGNTALMFAAQNGYLSVVTFLIENNANYKLENQSENNASLLASINLDTIEYLLRNKNYNPFSRKNKNINEFLRNNHINIDGIWGHGPRNFADLYKKDLINLMNRLKSVVDYFQSIWKDNQE